MQIQTVQSSPTPVSLLSPSQINREGLRRIEEGAQAIRAKALELTDTWGGAMFIMEPERCRKLFQALGFATDVAAEVYQRAYELHYVKHIHASGDSTSAFTWHGPDATILVLRGFEEPGNAFAAVTDETAESYLQSGHALFNEIMRVLPEYASTLMFSTEVGCNVLGAFGASISEGKLFELASAQVWWSAHARPRREARRLHAVRPRLHPHALCHHRIAETSSPPRAGRNNG